MQLKFLDKCANRESFEHQICSSQVSSMPTLNIEVFNDGLSIALLKVMLENQSCKIIDYSCSRIIDSQNCFYNIIEELFFEFPDVTKISIDKSDLQNFNLICSTREIKFRNEDLNYVCHKKRIAVTALKPSDGGIHLGHYFGNIKPLIENQNQYDCVFIFADLQLLNIDKKFYSEKIRLENIKLMLRQLIALGVDPKRTKILIESRYKSSALKEFVQLSDFVTDSRILRNPYIKYEKNSLNGNKPVKMSVLNYPIMETMDFYLTKADIMFSNMDNKACVELTNEIYQKMYAARLMPRKKVKLIHGLYDYLPGIDGKKMSKSNNNAIFLTDSCDIIQYKVNKMFTDPNRISADIPGNTNYNVVFKFLKLFMTREDYLDIKTQYEKGKIKDMETKKILSKYITEFICDIQTKVSEIDDEIINNIIGDEKI